MMGDYHVRFCERFRVKFPLPTRYKRENKMSAENKITKEKNILLVLSTKKDSSNEQLELIELFCGTVIFSVTDDKLSNADNRIFACGDISLLNKEISQLRIIREISWGFENYENENTLFVSLGSVPINVHNVGVYFRSMFEENDYFEKIESEHEFQRLTESNKDSMALRKGIYLSEIVRKETKEKREILNFRLLRCSSNLTGPTDNFRATDHKIVNSLNDAIKYSFIEETKVNHVLAQIYQNVKKDDGSKKERKAKIKAHSDKTKDMPKDGIIAFCTFYDKANFEHLKPSKKDKFDWVYKETSGLTRLHFKLKATVNDDSLVKHFSVTLYPNSVFLIPLSTNRLYTHEIKPSVLNIDRIPIRLGYVARCSDLEASYINGQTYITEDGELIKLEQIGEGDMGDLRDSYYKENRTEEKVKYGKVHFSMNSGDYKKPIF
jgi:hypothetical protein